MGWNMLTGEWLPFIDALPNHEMCAVCGAEIAKQHEQSERRGHLIKQWHMEDHEDMRLVTYQSQNETQKLALKAATVLAERWKTTPRGGLWLWSTSFGLGKTHLLYALLWEALNIGLTIAVYDEPTLLESIKATYKDTPGEHTSETEQKILQQASDADVFGFDDLGRGYVKNGSSAWLQDILYRIFNRRFDRGLPTIVTSNMSPADLSTRIGGAATSRLYGLCPKPIRLDGQDWRRREG